ncbi:MAG TPA: xanthine dehydrogenase family protein subunit M [Ktedonobacterales bacterium]|jgi:xanthine dehydrogenase YagS FAD-binding subunit
MRAFEHISATSAEDARADLNAQRDGEARFIAGGTDLLTLMKAGLVAPTRLIDLKPLTHLRGIRRQPDGATSIGALTTLANIERDPGIASAFPMLMQAIRDAATPQLRAMATIGGNLLQQYRCWYYREGLNCWLAGGDECFAREGQNQYHAIFQNGPCVAAHPSDLAPALIALDATVTIQRQSGERETLVEDLLIAPTNDRRVAHTLGQGEIITRINIPAPSPAARGVYLKAMERQAWSFALASVAARLTLEGDTVREAWIVLGGVANTPQRAREAEAALIGQPITSELAARAAALAVQGVTPLTLNGYKVRLTRELTRRAILQASGREP